MLLLNPYFFITIFKLRLSLVVQLRHRVCLMFRSEIMSTWRTWIKQSCFSILDCFYQISIFVVVIDMYVIFCFTLFNSLQRGKKDKTSCFKMFISSFLIVPSYLSNKCKLWEPLKSFGLNIPLSWFFSHLEGFSPWMKLFKKRISKCLTSNLKFFLFHWGTHNHKNQNVIP